MRIHKVSRFAFLGSVVAFGGCGDDEARSSLTGPASDGGAGVGADADADGTVGSESGAPDDGAIGGDAGRDAHGDAPSQDAIPPQDAVSHDVSGATVSTAAELKAALSNAAPGTTIVVACGRYVDTASDSDGQHAFSPAQSGSATAPITLQSETKGCAVLAARDNNTAALSIEGRSYIVIDGFKVEGMLALNNSSNNTLKNNDVTIGGLLWSDPSLHWGIALHSGSNNNIVRNNKVSEMGSFGAGNGNHNTAAVLVGFNANNNVIENNDADAGATAYSAFGQKGGDISGNMWRNNIARNGKAGFLGMGSTDGTLWSQDNSIYQNIVLNSARAFEFDHNTRQFSIYNNTAYNVQLFVWSIAEDGQPNTAHKFWNNIVADTAVVGYDVNGAPSSNFSALLSESNYNDFIGVTDMAHWNWGGGKYVTLTNWKATGFDANSISANPLFVSAPGNLKLQSGSPVKGTGKGGVDMGAYPTGAEVIGIQ